LLDDVVAFNGGTNVLKTLDVPGLGGMVVGPLGDILDGNIEFPGDWGGVVDNDEVADGLNRVDESVTPALLES
jgi:hypothetical protein